MRKLRCKLVNRYLFLTATTNPKSADLANVLEPFQVNKSNNNKLSTQV